MCHVALSAKLGGRLKLLDGRDSETTANNATNEHWHRRCAVIDNQFHCPLRVRAAAEKADVTGCP